MRYKKPILISMRKIGRLPDHFTLLTRCRFFHSLVTPAWEHSLTPAIPNSIKIGYTTQYCPCTDNYQEVESLLQLPFKEPIRNLNLLCANKSPLPPKAPIRAKLLLTSHHIARQVLTYQFPSRIS